MTIHPPGAMTEPLFSRDAYRRECDATVERTTDDGVVLSHTVLYPGGGGQPADHGTLTTPGGTFPITGTDRRDGVLLHRVQPPFTAVTGHTVHVTVDWTRRYGLMRTHTALHILCGVIWRDYRVPVTGGNMEPLQGRLDFDFEALDRDMIGEIETKLNTEVAARRPVRVAFLSREEALAVPDLVRTKVNLVPKHLETIRTVEIVGLDLQADGGTHVANTAEVGPLRIVKYKSKGRTNKRLTIALDPVVATDDAQSQK